MDDIKTYGIFFKTINSSLSTNPDLVISITLKKLIATYYLDRILKLKKADINDLENLKLNNTSAEIMLEIIGEKYPKIAMTNGVYELSKKIFLDTIDIAFEQIQTHLCWEDCFNASADKCPKVRNKIKLSIDKYDFIQEGYQILNKKGEIDRFIVTKCDKYEKATPQAMTQAQKERIKKIKDGLRIAYFDAETIEEAYVIQNDLIKKGQIKNPRGRRPDDQQVQIMRLRRKKTNF